MGRAKRRIVATGLFLLLLHLPTASEGSTLEEVNTRGILRCGVAEIGVGLSYVNETGNWAGFFPDYCRAVAAATLGRADAVDFVLTDVGNRFDALQSRTIDVLIKRLREKIEQNPKSPELLLTIYGEGYVLASDVTDTLED